MAKIEHFEINNSIIIVAVIKQHARWNQMQHNVSFPGMSNYLQLFF